MDEELVPVLLCEVELTVVDPDVLVGLVKEFVPVLGSMLVGVAKLETDAVAAIKATQLIVICLLDYPSVYQVFDPIDRSLFKDKILVNLTTANAAEGPEMSKWAAERGVKNYFDGAIMHVPPHVGTKHACTFISGGTEAAFREIEPSLKSTGEHEYLGEEVNSSAVHDAALLLG